MKGRPKKFAGSKDARRLSGALESTLPMVVEFIIEWEGARAEPRRRGAGDRRRRALQLIAQRYGTSASTLERLHRKLRWLAEPVARALLGGQEAVPIRVGNTDMVVTLGPTRGPDGPT